MALVLGVNYSGRSASIILAGMTGSPYSEGVGFSAAGRAPLAHANASGGGKPDLVLEASLLLGLELGVARGKPRRA